jgi:phenylalanyl-tRNA synthetase beta chain
MKLLLSWLREFVDVDVPPLELKRLLLDATAEVESVEYVGGDWDAERIRVGEVVAVDPHPNADRLRLATVETGNGRQQVVCGAPNVAVGQKIAFATEGARIFDGHTGKASVLKRSTIRGVESAGMVLSERELGLSEQHEGILVLPEDAPVGRPLVEQLGDVVLDLSTWANRADLLGVRGLAREVAALTGKGLRRPASDFSFAGPKVEDLLSVEVEDEELCPRFTASVIQGVRIGPSPDWMQQRLIRHGMRPINNVVDITNYVMLETGQPMHAFDYDLVRGKKIIVRRARPGEKLTTLDGVERELQNFMGVVCDVEGPTSIAGIMGGLVSEVSDQTVNVILEAANWHAGSIRKTSSRLHLRSEAGLRFEKGLGVELTMDAQCRALHLFERLTGGKVAQGHIAVPNREWVAPVISLPKARIEQVLGLEIPEREVERILVGLGFGVRMTQESIEATVPNWRPDVRIGDDVVEEVGRIHGYDKLPTTFLRGVLPEAEPRPLESLRERLRDLAASLGFQEVITYSLVDRQQLERVVAPQDERRNEPLSVTNPVAAQDSLLRTSLRGSLLETYAANRRLVEGPLRLFEIGVEYLPTEADLPHERPVLCALVGGEGLDRWGRAGGEPVDFFEAKGVCAALLEWVGLEAAWRRDEGFALLPGHTATASVEGRDVGVVARVHPATAAAFDIDDAVYLVELWIEDMAGLLPERPDYSPPPRYPAVRHDIALLVEGELPAGRVLELVRSHRSRGVRISGEVFDEYRGPGIPEGKKSLAVRLHYQADDRTLTDQQVAPIQQGLLARLEKELGAQQRG